MADYSFKKVSLTSIQPLLARASASRDPHIGFTDFASEQFVKNIDMPVENLTTNYQWRMSFIRRTVIYDSIVEKFVTENENPLVVLLAGGLDTRYLRLHDKGCNFDCIDIDLPEVIHCKQKLLTGFEGMSRYSCLPYSITELDWVKYIDSSRNTIFLLEGVLMYLQPTDVHRIFSTLTGQFMASTLAFDVCSTRMVRRRTIYSKLNGLDLVKFKWSVRDVFNLSELPLNGMSTESLPYIVYDDNQMSWRQKLNRFLSPDTRTDFAISICRPNLTPVEK